VLLILVATTAFIFTSRFQSKTNIFIGNTIISARLAQSEEQKDKGLSGIGQLQKNEGMLFVYKEDGLHGVWMKDMKMSIDAIWLDKNKKVVHIVQQISPKSYP